MKQFTRFSVCLLAVVSLAVSVFADEPTTVVVDGKVRRLGLKTPTAEQAAWMESNFPKYHAIRLNQLGLDRVNAHRKARGQGNLSGADVPLAAFGQEAQPGTATAPAAAGSAASASGPAGAGSSVDNSTLNAFPPVGDQGPIGSCVAWATTYYQLTYETAFARSWNAKTGGSGNYFSPRWTYNMINGGQDTGAYYSDAYNLLVKHGACRFSEFPYANDYLPWCTAGSAWRGAISCRVKAQGTVGGSGDTLISNIKTQLINGHCLVYGTYVSGWKRMTISGTVHPGESIAGYQTKNPTGGHAMTLVGYDDNVWCDLNGNGIKDTGEVGAFKIANSWGTSDWNGGFRWIAYDAIRATSAVVGFRPTDRGGAIFSSGPYTITVAASYTPKYIAEVTLNGARRDRIRISLGTSAASGTTPTSSWAPYAFQSLWNNGGACNFTGGTGTNGVDGTFAFDLTDISAAGTGRWFVKVQSTASGSPTICKAYTLYNVAGSTTIPAASPMVPQTANNNTVTVFVPQGSYKPPKLPVPPSIALQPSNVTCYWGQSPAFSVMASGDVPLAYQWQKNTGAGWADIAGATARDYKYLNVPSGVNPTKANPAGTPSAANGNQFRCHVTNAAGEAYSSVAKLTVLNPRTGKP